MELAGERVTYFADVVLPIPVAQYFTYRVPYEFTDAVNLGTRVVVQFGRKKILTAIVVNKHTLAPKKYEAKYILDILDDIPCVNDLQIKFWEWIAEYYMCSVGEVMNAAVPSGFKLTSQSRIQLNPEFNADEKQASLTENEWLLIERLQKTDSLAYHEAAEVLELKNPYKSIKYLIAQRAILLFEELKEKFKPKRIKLIRLKNEIASSDDIINNILDQLAKAPKQEAVLLKYLSKVGTSPSVLIDFEGLEKQYFIKEDTLLSTAALSALIKKGIFEENEKIVPRFTFQNREAATKISLSIEQEKAKSEILNLFESKDTVLLHGVTGSGKTEIYVTLIENVINSGSQALLLLPEIVLTAQIVNRLRGIFGEQMGVYHSRFSDNERVEVWEAVRDGKLNFVVGVRSSIFLPFNNLGLIVVDEEHEPSFKQYEPAPRYNARDTAQVLARLHHAKVLLGSATPSIESYYLSKIGHYGLVSLMVRFGEASLPKVSLIDMRKEKKQRKIKGDFSNRLLEAIGKNIESGKQVILFQNRRGYAPYIMCEDCGEIPHCKNCAVSLTYHMYTGTLVCHYCGYKEQVTGECKNCASTKMQTLGIGTEKIEDELSLIFPNTNIERMDLDTTRRKYSYERILEHFSKGETQILVGTQMVSKGLDFANVELVGVFDIDRLIYFPDFRSHERAYQLISQVSGRAGRRGMEGEVLIQTSSPEHSLLKYVVNHDYISFFNQEIKERKLHLYPPFSRLIRLTVRDIEREKANEAAEQLSFLLKGSLGMRRVIGPQSPVVDKIRNNYLKNILIKLERGKLDLKKVKKIIKEAVSNLGDKKRFKKVDVILDVDCW